VPGVRAVVYTRISRDATGEGLGVERQREACVALAEGRGWDVVDIIVENDVSATKGTRPGFSRLLGLIDGAAVDVVVVWAADRLVRRLVDLEDVITRCEASGVKLATVSGDLDLSTDQGRLVARILASVARGEVERKSTRQRAAYMQLAQRGQPHSGGRSRPFGYLADRVTPHPAEASEVVDAYARLLAGGTLAAIGRRWRELGTHPAAWTNTTAVARVLRSPRNAGLREHRGDVIGPADWPALVPEETWRAACCVLDDPERARTPYGRTLLGGLALCAVCDGRIEGTRRDGRDYPTYRCAAGRHVHRRASEIDDHVSRIVVCRLSLDDARALLVADNRPNARALSNEAAALRARLETLAVVFADGGLTASQLRTATERVRGKLVDVEGRLADAGRVSVLGPLIGAPDVENVWRGFALDEKRAVIDTLMTVRLRRPGRGARHLNPESVEITWKS
jgi:DNA invertase Pin-like site-specific DNA recombinase